MNLTIRRAQLAEIFALRHAALRPGRPAMTATFDGDEAHDTRHFAALLPEQGVVTCASFMPAPWEHAPAWQLRGMATRADLIRRGFGTRLLHEAQRALTTEFGTRVIWCNARSGAVGFYEAQGWRVVSAVFDVADVGPHVRMIAGP